MFVYNPLFVYNPNQASHTIFQVGDGRVVVPPLCNFEGTIEGAGGAPELIGKDAGIVVPYLDIEAMAKAITDLAADPGRRKEMGERARTKVDESFSAANYADQILRIVE